MLGAVSSPAIAIRDSWHRFWYLPADPIGICLLRIASGSILLYTLAVWSLDLTSFFGYSQGWQSGALVERIEHGQWSFSFWWWIADDYLWLAHLVAMLIVIAFTVGWQTQVTKFASFLICVSYANRVPMVQFGLDQITAAWLMYLCLGPCGACLSVDQWLRRRKQPGEKSNDISVHRSSGARLSMRMIQVHLCIVYLWAGLSKIQGQSWLQGDALWRVASNYEHQQLSLTFLAYVPWLSQLATICTPAWELSFAFLVWNRRLRLPLLSLGIAMHIAIGLFLGLWPFALIMMFGYLSFAPPAVLRRWVNSIAALAIAKQKPPEIPVAPINQPAVLANDDDAIETVPISASAVYQAPICDPSARLITNPRYEMMIDDQDRNNMVLLVERSAKRRCTLIKALEDVGYRCVGLDAWPEAIEVFNVLRPRCVLCNAARTPNSELRFWFNQIQARADGRFVVLVEPAQAEQLTLNHEQVIVIAVPASFEQICQALGGTTVGPHRRSQIDAIKPSQEGDAGGDQIFSFATKTQP